MQEQEGLANLNPVPPKQIAILLAFISLCFAAAAQENLVRNPSFESLIRCPGNAYEMDSSTTVFITVLDWFAPNKSAVINASPDYYHSCATEASGFSVPSNNVALNRNARTGNAYTGIISVQAPSYSSTLREYIGSRLLQPLVAGNNYLVTFYIAATDVYLGHTSDMGLYFSSSYSNYAVAGEIPETPQIQNPPTRILNDPASWMKISGSYKAAGDEEWVIIGNFRENRASTYQSPPGDHWAYYLIDDVSVINYIPNHTNKDTAICSGESVSLSMRPGFDSCIWNDGSTLPKRSFFTAGTYWVTSIFNDTMRYTDTLTLTTIPSDTTVVDTAFCTSGTIALTAKTADQYLWSTNEASRSIQVNMPGTYWLISHSGSCISIDTFHVAEFPLPYISSLKDTIVCFDEVEKILLDAGSFKSYLWQPTGETTRTIYSTMAQIYQLSVSDNNECSTHKMIAVDESCSGNLFLPNIFTPNDDKLNDVFKPAAKSVDQYSLSIINRWGEIVFITSDPNLAWNGKDAPEGVYTVLVRYSLPGREPQTIRSTLTLLR